MIERRHACLDCGLGWPTYGFSEGDTRCAYCPSSRVFVTEESPANGVNYGDTNCPGVAVTTRGATPGGQS